MSRNQTFIEKCYKNKQGNIILAQKPNFPIVVWLISMAITLIVKNGAVHNLFAVLAFGAIFTWAWLELFHGDTYFRRLLGLVVLVATIYNRI